MDRNGTSFGQKRIGKLFAVLWILTAALAMQFVASAQGLSSRFSAEANAGNFSSSDNGTSDPTLSRHIIRAAPVADLRFTTDRSDAKATPGGPDAPLLPSRLIQNAPAYGPIAAYDFAAFIRTGLLSHHIRVRGPPSVIA